MLFYSSPTQVLFTDVDMVWLSDPRPWLVLKARVRAMLEPTAPKMRPRKKRRRRKKLQAAASSSQGSPFSKQA